MTNLEKIMKDKDISAKTKFRVSQEAVFLLVTYKWENCILRKSKRNKIDSFE